MFRTTTLGGVNLTGRGVWEAFPLKNALEACDGFDCQCDGMESQQETSPHTRVRDYLDLR